MFNFIICQLYHSKSASPLSQGKDMQRSTHSGFNGTTRGKDQGSPNASQGRTLTVQGVITCPRASSYCRWPGKIQPSCGLRCLTFSRKHREAECSQQRRCRGEKPTQGGSKTVTKGTMRTGAEKLNAPCHPSNPVLHLSQPQTQQRVHLLNRWPR